MQWIKRLSLFSHRATFADAPEPVASPASGPLTSAGSLPDCAAAIDRALSTPAGHLIVTGWCVPSSNPNFTARLKHGDVFISLDYAMLARLRRQDVFDSIDIARSSPVGDRVGFVAMLTLPPDARSVELMIGNGREQLMLSAPLRRLGANKADIFELIEIARLTENPAVFERLGPAIDDLVKSSPLPKAAVQVSEFGLSPVSPNVSIVVPLYGRIDLMEYQLAHFANDPEFKDVELIFVLDDPRLRNELEQRVEFLHALYRVSFRLILLGENLGYAGANNVGVAHASADTLLLLNSDVFPSAPGWLSGLRQSLSDLPGAGVVSPRLLFASGALQYGGMSFDRSRHGAPYILNDHPGKGLPPDRRTEPYPVQAATGACLMMPTALYREVGGLDQGYIVGDFEDSDLCMKLRSIGRSIWCVPSSVLYHLERQSLASIGEASLRQYLTLYNAWRHQERWAPAIEALADQWEAIG
jgi:GT2 family glycosyltransferase